MAGSVNKVVLIGNLGKDPDIRTTRSGDPIANLTLATSEKWRDKQTGEKREKTEWHRVVFMNKGLAEVAETYLRKGDTIYVEGKLQTNKWQDKDGVDRYTTEVVLCGFDGKMVMLSTKNKKSDGRDGGRSDDSRVNQDRQASRGDDRGGYDSRSGRPGRDDTRRDSRDRPRDSGGQGQSSYARDDMDDEVPF